MTKKIISCVIALTLLLSLAVISVSADTALTIVAKDATVEQGGDIVVQYTVTAPAESIVYFAFNSSWDTNDLTYKSHELKSITSDTAVTVDAANGTLSYQTLNDNNASATFADTVVLEVTFTAKDSISGTSYDAAVAVEKWSDDDEAYVSAAYDQIFAADVATTNGKVTITAPAVDPVIAVTAAIDGTGYIGSALTANVTVTSDDVPVESPVLTYAWTIGDAVVSTNATYTPDAADNGKTVKLVATYSGVASNEATKAITLDPADVPTDKPLVSVAKKTVTITNDADTTVDVDITLAGSTGFSGMGIEISYPEALTLTDVECPEIEGAIYTGPETIDGNLFTWYVENGGDVTYNGTLATLTFAIDGDTADGTVYDIVVTYYKGLDGLAEEGDFNYAVAGDIALDYSNGKITINKAYNRTGDIDEDGDTDDADAILLMKYLAKWNVEVDDTALDTNGDTKVNGKDVTHLLRYLAGWEGVELSFRG